MKRIRASFAGSVALLLVTVPAWSQQPIVYPAKGQTVEQQQRDEGDCYVWAKQYTGVDPAAVVQQQPPQKSSSWRSGERAGGASRGALGGAAIGAVAGTMLGGRKARQNAAAQDQAAVGQTQAQIDTYYRAYGACLEGRGYTIK